MSTQKGIWWRAVAWAAAGMLAVAVSSARADVVTDQAAAILIFPKIVFDNTGPSIDTIVQVTNTSGTLAKARCFYVNANSHCSNFGAPGVPLVCEINADCNPTGISGGICQAGWDERDFQMTLTKRQPLSWRVSQGLTQPCPPDVPAESCPEDRVPLSGGRVADQSGQSNEDTSIPPVPEEPFVGELKCVQVDVGTSLPIELNDLKGEATIVTTSTAGGVDVRKYNAYGIQATGFQDGSPNQLNLGGPDAEYNACPNVTVLDHFFDTGTGNGVATHDGTVIDAVATNVVFVPCSEDFENRDPAFGQATLQMLIYNEFEQRFSSATRITCFKEIRLSDIDTRVGPGDDGSSIFNASVQGTLTGQTRIRAVAGTSGRANKVLVLAEEDWLGRSFTTARTPHNIQPDSPTAPALGDVIVLSNEF